MVSSPLQVFLELLVGIVVQAGLTLWFIVSKLFEFFQSIVIYSGGSPISLILAISVTAGIVIFLRKQIFSSTKSLIIFAAILIGIIVVILGLFALIG